ncbi:ThuA domain-containing protein [Glaciecola sp. SC05]|uniref:ThuA domain-containing protein n=1 Tax=Glaciecola sp. SC05 TaxID=1987355 RepID=UPI003529210F
MKFCAALVLAFFLASCAHVELPKNHSTSNTQKINVLIVDGQNNHTVWPKATVMMKTYLEDSELFSVDVYRTKLVWRGEAELPYLKLYNTDAHQLVEQPATDDSFMPNFAKYDVVISNFGYRAADWPLAAQSAFEDYMKNGGGFVSVHAANNTFVQWHEYQKMTGLGGWGGRDESDGPYVYFDENGRLIRDYSPGEGGAHGTKHEFQITKRNDHPILLGMPEVWMHATDECYGDLRGPAENMVVIASALCPKEENGTGKHEPILMVLNYGEGRIFHTTLGHQQESYESVGFITTFLRGTEWAATGKVTQPVPSDFPSKSASSRRVFIQ